MILHGRTRTQGYGIKADWEVMGRAKAQLHIPVIGNGDSEFPRGRHRLFQPNGLRRCHDRTGRSGKSVDFPADPEYAPGAACPEPSLEEREDTILRHLGMMGERRGEVHGVREFRKHLIWYTKGLRGCTDFRSRIPLWNTVSEMAGGIQEYFQNLKNPPLFS